MVCESFVSRFYGVLQVLAQQTANRLLLVEMFCILFWNWGSRRCLLLVNCKIFIILSVKVSIAKSVQME